MSQPRFCPQCGSPVEAGERFCANCGTRMPEQPPPAMPPYAPPSQPPVTAPPSSTGRIVLLAVIGLVALVIVGGGIGWALINRSSTATITPTATATPRPARTTTPQPTASPIGGVVGQPTPLGAAALARTSQAQTAQAQALLAPTQTAQAQALLAPTQTAQALEAEVSALFAASRRVFYDEFVDNRNAWFTGVFQEIELDLIEDGVFKVLWTGRGTSYELYELSAFTNFISEVDCRIARGGGDGSCSLVFSHNNNVGFYKFEFFIDYYRLFIVPAEGDLTTLVEGDPRLFTTIGDVNRLRVIKQGDRIRLFINGVLVDDLRDATYPTGRIGVSTTCYREEGGVEVHFDNFGIWSLPDG
ncbi:MAG: zinc-ribbon domain-containing protein [Chloroflexus sp.]|nr:zinc-ribbon domain-containing protein [Chloroflexus sp.]